LAVGPERQCRENSNLDSIDDHVAAAISPAGGSFWLVAFEFGGSPAHESLYPSGSLDLVE